MFSGSDPLEEVTARARSERNVRRATGASVGLRGRGQNLSHQNYREVTEAILADDAVTTWSGSVFASGPIQADGGQVAITWILFEHT